jgi:inorganic pyrophosphatase
MKNSVRKRASASPSASSDGCGDFHGPCVGADFRLNQPAFASPRSPAMNVDAISIGNNPPYEVNVVIEVPIGGEPIKYEMDKHVGALVVDRFLYTSMRYPGNYGFIPHTLSDDGDPCDVIVANTRAIIPGAIMSCKIVGVLLMEDEAGGDEKLLAVPSAKLTQRYAKIENFVDLPEITLKQIEHFFAHYKDLEPNKWVKITRWGDAAEARSLVLAGIERAKAKAK